MSTMVISPVRPGTLRPAEVRGQLRLTRRGRLVIFLVSLAVVLTVGVFLGAGSTATGERGTSAPTTVVMIAPGDTLWDIASRLTPSGADVRETMYDIKRLNALESSALVAGQRLRVPAVE